MRYWISVKNRQEVKQQYKVEQRHEYRNQDIKTELKKQQQQLDSNQKTKGSLKSLIVKAENHFVFSFWSSFCSPYSVTYQVFPWICSPLSCFSIINHFPVCLYTRSYFAFYHPRCLCQFFLFWFWPVYVFLVTDKGSWCLMMQLCCTINLENV